MAYKGLKFPLRLMLCVKPYRCKFLTEFKVDYYCTLASPQDTIPNPKKPTSKPISYLGTGDPKTARYWRSVLKRAVRQNDEFNNLKPGLIDFVPTVLKMKYEQSPEEIRQLYPDVARIIQNAKDKVLNDSFNEERKEEQIVHFPFQTELNSNENIIRPNNNENPLDTNSVEPKSTNSRIPPMKSVESIEKLNKSVLNLIAHLDKQSLPNENEDEDRYLDLKEEIWRADYGTPNPNWPASNIPCGGCGALLHCQDTGIPGYIPSERFGDLSEKELRQEICQRCVFIHHYNVALNVTIHSDSYADILKTIRDARSLVILLVDLTDFPCSIWPGVVDLVGTQKPLFVIGNKVDLLPRDGKAYLNRIRDSLETNLDQIGVKVGRNLLYTGLISAKTGYGVETLITKLQKHWGSKGDVHIVGCTNVGKSTLFNTLLQSDYCKVQAADLVQRATTSVWPGTTLNLLKFPILRPSGFNMYVRTQRLINEHNANIAEAKLRTSMYKQTRDQQYATLMGKIGMTFKLPPNDDLTMPTMVKNKKYFDPDDPAFKGGKFCYDTPGAIYKDQILDLLTVQELSLTLCNEIIHPRTFTLRVDQTLFLAGLARIDCLNIDPGIKNVNLTFFASPHLPVHILPTIEADLFYEQNLGTKLMKVPSGSSERLKLFPKLEGRVIEMPKGLGLNESCADLVLSSAGWVAVTLEKFKSCVLKVSTPEGRGVHQRTPSMLRYSVKLRGKKLFQSPAYENRLGSVVD